MNPESTKNPSLIEYIFIKDIPVSLVVLQVVFWEKYSTIHKSKYFKKLL